MTWEEYRQLTTIVRNSKTLLSQDLMAGSPSFGVIKYQITDFDITITKSYVTRKISKDSGIKDYAFGRKFINDYTYDFFKFDHDHGMAELKVLSTMMYHHMPSMRIYIYHPTSRDIELTSVGDTTVFQEALVYMNLMVSIDSNHAHKLLF